MRILTVCLGNICRSPAAEAAIRSAAVEAGLDVEVDSAGTGRYHIGDGPNPRSIDAGAEVGLEVTGRARQVTLDDFAEFDLIVAMDHSNYQDLRRLAPTEAGRQKVRLFRDFDTDSVGEEVPPITSSLTRIGHVIAEGATAEEAIANAEAARNSIVIQTEKDR